MIIEVIIICSLIQADPFYDCPPWYDGDYESPSGDFWYIVIWSDWNVPCWKDGKIIVRGGCAVYPSNSIFLSNQTHGMESVKPKWEGMTVLQHELEHLKCECTWHTES